eukprot:4129323-Lingulodinium_polyedra.AAC.1
MTSWRQRSPQRRPPFATSSWNTRSGPISRPGRPRPRLPSGARMRPMSRGALLKKEELELFAQQGSSSRRWCPTRSILAVGRQPSCRCSQRSGPGLMLRAQPWQH